MTGFAQFFDNLQSDSHMAARVLRLLLRGVAGGYSVGVRLREFGFQHGYWQTTTLPVPVISVGNITTGGTGKTPAVIWLVRKLQEMGKRQPVILSRGYGQDEVRLLQESLPAIPHFTHRRRAKAGQEALQKLGQQLCFVLDDGFQHRRLVRDVDIVLIDATNPFGYGYLVPRGLLREPLSQLRRAHAIILTRCNQVQPESLQSLSKRIRELAPHALQAQAIHAPKALRLLGKSESYPPSFLWGKTCLLFAGIGNPQSFYRTAATLGIHIAQSVYFLDHHAYSAADLSKLVDQACLARAKCLLTTAKDAVKLLALPTPPLPIWILDIELEIQSGEAELVKLLQPLI